MVKRIFLTTTGANTWTVPNDWNSSNNTIECIGAGAAGRHVGFIPFVLSGGGGGGAYAKKSNLTLTPGLSVDYSVGDGGTTTDGDDTFFNSASFSGSSVGAKGGKVCTFISGVFTPGLGGAASESIGDVKHSGGNGGSNNGSGGGGGGGAAGPSGSGKDGGYSAGSGDNIGGGGGGGANGGSSTAGSNGTALGGGNGGQGPNGAGAGAGSSTDGTNGSDGGGGGGGRNAGTGGNGGNGAEWGEAGAGGGGGGTSTGVAGHGGLYGGGGASVADPFGVGANGIGAQGIIVITYEPVAGFTQAYILG